MHLDNIGLVLRRVVSGRMIIRDRKRHERQKRRKKEKLRNKKEEQIPVFDKSKPDVTFAFLCDGSYDAFDLLSM